VLIPSRSTKLNPASTALRVRFTTASSRRDKSVIVKKRVSLVCVKVVLGKAQYVPSRNKTPRFARARIPGEN
jgi:hypothetical protein